MFCEGSGKTYTMMGPVDNPGVNRRALNELFVTQKNREEFYEYNISLSMFEIYNDKPRDLLVSSKVSMKYLSDQQCQSIKSKAVRPKISKTFVYVLLRKTF